MRLGGVRRGANYGVQLRIGTASNRDTKQHRVNSEKHGCADSKSKGYGVKRVLTISQVRSVPMDDKFIDCGPQALVSVL